MNARRGERETEKMVSNLKIEILGFFHICMLSPPRDILNVMHQSQASFWMSKSLRVLMHEGERESIILGEGGMGEGVVVVGVLLIFWSFHYFGIASPSSHLTHTHMYLCICGNMHMQKQFTFFGEKEIGKIVVRTRWDFSHGE